MACSQDLVLFFSPYAGIWPHAMPEALVAGALQRQGAKVVYAVCDGIYSGGCYVMSAHWLSGDSVDAAREKFCRRCRKQRDLLIKYLGAEVVVVDSFVDGDDLNLIESISGEVTLDNLEEFEFDGFSVGRYAMHETIIHHKMTSLSEVNDISLREFRLNLKHVLMTYCIVKKLIDQFCPYRFVVYNTHVSTNYMLMNLAERAGIHTFGLHAGGNMSDRFATLYVFRKDMVELYKDWILRFTQSWHVLPTTEQGIREAARHFLALASGQTVWVYSAPKGTRNFDVRSYFGIKFNQKILLATLSSYDELYSSQMLGVMGTYPLVFPTQVEWLREVISFIRQREDLFLVIRVHPRELPNRRDAVHSRHAKMLAEELKQLPDNVRVNWPSDAISLYDLIPHIDVGLNGWSSTGKELSMLGIPVVIYSKDIIYYPDSLNILAKDRSDYFRCIDKALSEGWSFERVRQVYRWLAVEYTLGVISINDQFVFKEGIRSYWRRALNRIYQILTRRFEVRRLRHPLKEEVKFAQVIMNEASIVDLQIIDQTRLTVDEESIILRNEIGKILTTVYPDLPVGFSKTIDRLREVSNGV